MIDETKLHKETSRAARAQQLLDNELLQEAFTKLRASYLAQWEATTVEEQLLREKYWLAHRIVNVVESHFSKIVSNGKLAQKQLNDMAALAELKKVPA